jgi:TP901 family phage tail tape measure protein
MSDMKVSVVVGLVDRLTAPMRGLVGQFQAMGSRLANVGRQIGVIGGVIGAISFMGPMKQAAAYDAQIRDMAITYGLSGKEAENYIQKTKRAYEGLAMKVGQTSENLAKGAVELTRRGLAEPLIQQLMPTVGKVATASGAAVEDVAKTVFALSQTAKIAPEQMELALGRLVTAGKLGAFEFRNMAAEFPELTAQMAKLGVTGMESVAFLGAALQVAMLGTDSPDKAANNLKNFLTKVAAPEAIQKFQKELGVDVVKLMASAHAKGINPVEAVIQKMSEKLKVPQKEIDKIIKETQQKGLKGAEAGKEIKDRIGALLAGTKVGKLFADMQVLDFLIPTLLNTDKFKAFKDAILQAGVEDIEKDFATRMAGLDKQMEHFGEGVQHIGRRIGDAFAKNLPGAKAALESFQGWIKQTDEAFPGLIDKVLSIGGAILIFGAAIAILTPVFAALGAVVGLFGAALAFLFSPIGLIIAALVVLGLAAYWVYQNWDKVKAYLGEMWDGIKQKASDAWEGIKQSASNAWEGVKQYASNAWEAVKQAGSDAWEAAKVKGSEFVEWAKSIPGQLMEAMGDLAAKMLTAGKAAIQGLWDGMKSKVAEMLAWVAEVAGQIAERLSKLNPFGGGGPKPGEGPGSAPKSGEGSGSAPSTMDGFSPSSLPSRPLPPSGGVQKAEVGGRITVTATEGARIVNVESTNAAVPLEPNRGAMLGRA